MAYFGHATFFTLQNPIENIKRSFLTGRVTIAHCMIVYSGYFFLLYIFGLLFYILAKRGWATCWVITGSSTLGGVPASSSPEATRTRPAT
jgi:hypothetical protein